MTNSSSPAEREPTESPVKSILLNGKGQKITPDKTNVPMSAITPFWQDITNHPVLWVCVSIVNALCGFVTICFVFLGVAFASDSSPPPYELTKSELVLLSIFLLPLAIVNAIASLLAAMWTPLSWDKGVSPKRPPFTVRFWRSFRFIFVYNLLPLCIIYYLPPLTILLFHMANKATGGMLTIQNKSIKKVVDDYSFMLYELVHLAPLIAGLVYGYYKRHQQRSKKPSIKGKDVAA